MAVHSRLEEQVFLQLDELRRLRTENEQLHLKNKLLLAELGDQQGQQGQNQSQQRNRADVTSISANAETLKLKEQVEQLQGVIERLRDDLEDNESQKLELQMEVERLREALEEAEAQLASNQGGTSKMLGALGNSSVLRQKDELSDLEHELNKKARVLEDKQVALLNKEGQLREWEIRLSAKEAELQLQAIAPPRKDALEGPSSGNGVSFGSMGYAGVGADSASLQGTFGSAVGADRKLQFEIAKRKHQEDLEREKIEEMALESPSGLKEGLHQSKRRMMAMKEDIAIEEHKPSFSQIDPVASRLGHSSHVSQSIMNQSRRTYEYIKPRKTDDMIDSHKMTFDSKVRGEPSKGESSQIYQSKVRDVSGVGDPFLANNEQMDNNWIERPPEDFDHSADDGDKSTSPHQVGHQSFELNNGDNPEESGFREPQKATKTATEEGEEATERTSNPENSVNKKAVAFDLFEDKIDEKRRQTLIQKLERNRGVTAEKRAAAMAAAQIEKAKNPVPEGEKEGYLSRHRANNPQSQAPISNNFLGGIADKSQNASGVALNPRAAPPTQPNRWASDQTNPDDNIRGKVPIIHDKTGDYPREGPRKIPSSPADRRLGRPERLDLGADISPKPMTGQESRKSVGLSSNKKPDASKASPNDARYALDNPGTQVAKTTP